MTPAASSPGSPLLVIVGPTASGKTRVGVRLARRFDGEIVSADALQVYRGFDAATAKPTPAERSAVPHALVDCVDPREDFNLGDFVRAAEGAVARITRAGRRPVVVGGTGMYIRGLLKGLFGGPGRQEDLRRGLLARAAEGRDGLLHRYLQRLDPATAARIPAADMQRVVRALEVRLATGRSITDLQDEGWSRPDRYPAVKVGLSLPRDELYRRIDARVEDFFRAGLVEEVRGLLEAGVPREANAFKAIGYRETLAHLDGATDLDEAIRLVQRSTRRFAKRQLTWFRREEGVRWFDASAEGAEAEVEAHVASSLGDI